MSDAEELKPCPFCGGGFKKTDKYTVQHVYNKKCNLSGQLMSAKYIKNRPVEDALRVELGIAERDKENLFGAYQGIDNQLAETKGELAKAHADIDRLEDTQHQPLYRDGEQA